MAPVLDLSNHDLSTLDPACFRAAGISRAIIGCWDAPITIQIVQRLRAVGIIVEDLYCEVYNGLSYELREGHNAITVSRAVGGIERVWIAQEVDAQFEAPGQTPASRLAATARMDALLRASSEFEELPGIYTYDFYWRNKVGNALVYAGRRLWNSRPGTNDPNNPIPPIRAVSYGGWTECDIHQYSSTIWLCGRVRDHNYWFIEDDEMGMTPAETAWVQSIANKTQVLEMIVAGYGIDTDGDGKADLFGDEAIAWAYDPQHAWSAFLAATNNARNLAIHEENPSADIPDHSHGLPASTMGLHPGTVTSGAMRRQLRAEETYILPAERFNRVLSGVAPDYPTVPDTRLNTEEYQPDSPDYVEIGSVDAPEPAPEPGQLISTEDPS